MEMGHDESHTEYQSYLLRLWRIGKYGFWHAMLEPIDGIGHHNFANLEALFAFLRAQTDKTDSPKSG